MVREVTTNERGRYNATFLPIGRYRITATMSGFGPVTRDRVDVRLNETFTVDFRLDPTAKEGVTVVGERPLINTVTSDVKQSLTAEQILDRPTVQNLNNNNTFLALAETFAGFQENPTSGQNNPTTSSGSSINFNGTGTRGATFQIDGVNNDDASENQNRQGVNLATIQEFQVISNTFSAEFGRGYGAVVLVQTKSGTNDVKGEVFYYRQDSQWNALQYGALVKPDNQRPSYGGVVGLPIVKNELFGLVSFEHGRQSGQGSYVRDIFIPADLSGPRLSRGNDTPANRAWQDAVLARFGGLTPNDPRSNRTYQGIATFDRPVTDATLRLDWAPRASECGRPLPVLAAALRQRGRHSRRGHAAEQPAGQLRPHLDAHVLVADGRRAALRPRRARHERQHQGRQRHTGDPLRGLSRLRVDHRQRRQLPHQP